MTRFQTRKSPPNSLMKGAVIVASLLIIFPIAVRSWTTTTHSSSSFLAFRTHTRNGVLPVTTTKARHVTLLQMANEDDDEEENWDEEHLAHGMSDVHEESDAELKDSEDAAAWDAHDLSDPGMEAAAEERAVMLANEMAHKMKEGKQKKDKSTSNWNEEHLAHGISEVHEETSEELKEAEDAAAVDAHDVSDAGMEAAAEERAVMLANEMIHKMKEKAAAAAAKKKKE